MRIGTVMKPTNARSVRTNSARRQSTPPRPLPAMLSLLTHGASVELCVERREGVCCLEPGRPQRVLGRLAHQALAVGGGLLDVGTSDRQIGDESKDGQS